MPWMRVDSTVAHVPIESLRKVVQKFNIIQYSSIVSLKKTSPPAPVPQQLMALPSASGFHVPFHGWGKITHDTQTRVTAHRGRGT